MVYTNRTIDKLAAPSALAVHHYRTASMYWLRRLMSMTSCKNCTTRFLMSCAGDEISTVKVEWHWLLPMNGFNTRVWWLAFGNFCSTSRISVYFVRNNRFLSNMSLSQLLPYIASAWFVLYGWWCMADADSAADAWHMVVARVRPIRKSDIGYRQHQS